MCERAVESEPRRTPLSASLRAAGRPAHLWTDVCVWRAVAARMCVPLGRLSVRHTHTQTQGADGDNSDPFVLGCDHRAGAIGAPPSAGRPAGHGSSSDVGARLGSDRGGRLAGLWCRRRRSQRLDGPVPPHQFGSWWQQGQLPAGAQAAFSRNKCILAREAKCVLLKAIQL